MDFHQLLVFSAVMKYNNFSRAAETLYLTQPTVSAHIKSLEKELSVNLFQRQGGKLRPTKAAYILNEYARNLLSLKEKALMELQKEQQSVASELEIAASNVPGGYLLPQAVSRFQKLYPQVRFHIYETDTKGVVQKIHDGDYHFGVVGELIPQESLEYTPLTGDRLILIAAPHFAETRGWKNQTKLNLKVVLQSPLIMRPPTSATRRLWERELKNNGISFKNLHIAAIVHSNEAVKALVAAGTGVSIVSYLTVETYLQARILQGFTLADLELKRKFYVVSRKNRLLPPAADKFKDFLIAFYNKERVKEHH